MKFPTDEEALEKMAQMKVVRAKPYQVTIFIGGDLELAKAACQKFCDEKGECVTVEPTDYIYTGGSTPGVRVGFINYARFPRSRGKIFNEAMELGLWLLLTLDQESCTVIASDRNRWLTTREQSK